MKERITNTFKTSAILPALPSCGSKNLLTRFMKPASGSSSRVSKNKGEELRAVIANHPFFKDLRPDHLTALADCAMKTEFDPGELIFQQGDPANRFFLILKGKVALESRVKGRQPILIENIGAGDVLGWSWMVEPYLWHFDARAVEPIEAIFFYGTWLRELYEEDGTLGYEMLRRVAAVMLQRLQAARCRFVKEAGPAVAAFPDKSINTTKESQS